MLSRVLLDQSTLLSDLVVSRGWVSEQGIANHDPRVFSILETDILSKHRGNYFFAHVLLPHDPYVYMHDCSINYETPIWARHANIVSEDVIPDNVYEISNMLYFEQMDCALTSLRQIFDRMKSAGIFDQSIILVHGDHGSLIGNPRPVYQNRKIIKPSDFLVNYSTLFIVKFPREKGGIDERTLPLSTLLEDFSGSVRAYVLNQNIADVMNTVNKSEEKTGSYIFMQGTSPMWRVDINIFDQNEGERIH